MLILTLPSGLVPVLVRGLLYQGGFSQGLRARPWLASAGLRGEALTCLLGCWARAGQRDYSARTRGCQGCQQLRQPVYQMSVALLIVTPPSPLVLVLALPTMAGCYACFLACEFVATETIDTN